MSTTVIPIRIVPELIDAEHEYRVTVDGRPVTGFDSIVDPRRAGDLYRGCRDAADAGHAVELQRRPVGEWETVERAELPPRGATAPAD